MAYRRHISGWVKKTIRLLPHLLGKHSLPDLWPKLRQQIAINPEAGQLYYQLGQKYFRYRKLGVKFTNIALFRTALTFEYHLPHVALALAQSYLELGLFDLAQQQFLEIDDIALPGVRDGLEACLAEGKELRANTWKLEYLPYGIYQRFKIVSERIADVGRNELMVADVGGGRGVFSLFIPQHRYALLEPSVTGVSVPNLRFGDKTFDIVVCADVLEHLPKQDREPSINEMMRLARRRVYFTAPFGARNRELETSLYKLTKSRWLKEHLAHEASTLEEMKSFLEKQGVTCRIYPCSFLPAHFAMGYLNNHFLQDKEMLSAEVNEFFNTHYCDLNRQEPSYGYLFELILSG